MFHITENMLDYLPDYAPENDFHLDAIRSMVLEIDANAKFIIGIEHKPYSHCHLYIETEQELFYRKFRQNNIISKWKLRGRAAKGLARQYGKIDCVKDHQKMKAYTLKESIFVTNYSDEEIAILEDIAFKKTDSVRNLNYKEGCLEHIEKNIGNCHHNRFKVQSLIIEYLTNTNMNVTRNKVNTLYFYAVQFSSKENIKLNFNEINRELFS